MDWICIDCLAYIANDEATPDHRMAFHAHQNPENGVLVVGDVEDQFSSIECVGCGTRVAGTRHSAAFI